MIFIDSACEVSSVIIRGKVELWGTNGSIWAPARGHSYEAKVICRREYMYVSFCWKACIHSWGYLRLLTYIHVHCTYGWSEETTQPMSCKGYHQTNSTGWRHVGLLARLLSVSRKSVPLRLNLVSFSLVWMAFAHHLVDASWRMMIVTMVTVHQNCREMS